MAARWKNEHGNGDKGNKQSQNTLPAAGDDGRHASHLHRTLHKHARWQIGLRNGDMKPLEVSFRNPGLLPSGGLGDIPLLQRGSARGVNAVRFFYK